VSLAHELAHKPIRRFCEERVAQRNTRNTPSERGFSVVRAEGLEPPRAEAHQDLNPVVQAIHAYKWLEIAN